AAPTGYFHPPEPASHGRGTAAERDVRTNPAAAGLPPGSIRATALIETFRAGFETHGDPVRRGGQPRTSTTLADVIVIRSAGRIGKTAFGVPAAAQRMSCPARVSSR